MQCSKLQPNGRRLQALLWTFLLEPRRRHFQNEISSSDSRSPINGNGLKQELKRRHSHGIRLYGKAAEC